MAVWNMVFCSQLTNEHRTDAEFFKPEYTHLDSYLESIPYVNHLGSLALFVKKGIFDISPNRYRGNGIPLIRTFQIKTPIANDENLVFLAESDHEKEFFKTELLSGDIVLTKIGAGIGDIALLPSKYSRYNFSQNVAGVSVNRSKINPHYLIAFLISDVGRKQILRYMMPSGQGKLELRDIKKIKVARFENSEDQIALLVRKSEILIQESSAIYAQAQQLLESELGLDKLNFQKPVGYRAHFSELEASQRSDAEFFKPEYQELLNLLRQRKHSLIGRVFTISRGICINPRLYNETDGTPFIRIKELSLDKPLLPENSVKIKRVDVPTNFPFAVEGDYILAVIGATIGKTNLIDKSMAGSLFSNNTACLSPKIDISHPVAMELLLRSPAVQMQIQQRMAKTAQEKISDPELRRILIPKIEPTMLDELERKCEGAKAKLLESRQLLVHAKTRVEQLIEEAVK